MLLALVMAALAAEAPAAAAPAPAPSGASASARPVPRWELAVGPWVGQHAPQEAGNADTGFAFGGRGRARWSEAWGVELAVGGRPEGVAGNLALVRFLGDPSADLVAHAALGAGLQGRGEAHLSVGGGFDMVLVPWLDLRADARFEFDTAGTAALLFAVAPMVHTRRAYDLDDDGIADRADACPRDPEDRDEHLDTDGCPDGDNDGDGLADLQDACADVPEDPDGVLDRDGCPDPDDDEDGVVDVFDRCRDAPEDLDRFEDRDGCPDPDNDGDLVLDDRDECADVREDLDNYEDDDGCPDPDNDRDGVADRWDGDPLTPETWNGWRDGDGVPDAVPPVVLRLLGRLDVRFAPAASAA
ncbi:MAG: hypothetical protein ACK4YP_27185, partial [Myxococcota bacterium]